MWLCGLFRPRPGLCPTTFCGVTLNLTLICTFLVQSRQRNGLSHEVLRQFVELWCGGCFACVDIVSDGRGARILRARHTYFRFTLNTTGDSWEQIVYGALGWVLRQGINSFGLGPSESWCGLYTNTS